MQQRQLGSDGLVTSALGMGCMGLSQGYGPADDDESVRAIRRAAELGVTMFDTAMSYGQGHNERLIGRALAGLPWQVQVATKFGIVRDAGGVHLDGRPEHVRGYCEASLARLGVEVIDLYYLHRVDPQVPIADTIGAMAAARRRGQGPPSRRVRGHARPVGTGRGGTPHQRGGVRMVAGLARTGG